MTSFLPKKRKSSSNLIPAALFLTGAGLFLFFARESREANQASSSLSGRQVPAVSSGGSTSQAPAPEPSAPPLAQREFTIHSGLTRTDIGIGQTGFGQNTPLSAGPLASPAPGATADAADFDPLQHYDPEAEKAAMEAQLRQQVELPEDLKRQLEQPPPELPDDLKAQLNAPPPPIPEDIQKALKIPPRIVTLDEVNNPAGG